MKKTLRNQKGISLLEVMIGMLVFSLGMLMLIPMVVTSIVGNQTAHENDMVMQDMQNVVEAFKAGALPASGLDYSTEPHRYVMWWTQPTNPPTPNVEQLNVEVMWEDSKMQSHFRRVSTFVYRK